MAAADDIRDLQRQIVELRRDIDHGHEREATLIQHYCERAVAEQTRGRLPSAEVLAWCERGLKDSIERSKSIREVVMHSVKLSAWAGLAFIAWSLWESVKAKVGAKGP